MSEIRSIAFPPDGLAVLTGSSDSTARIWDPRTGQGQQLLRGHSGEIRSVAFSPDGRLVLTGVPTRRLASGIPGPAKRSAALSVCTTTHGRWWHRLHGRLDFNDLEALRGLNWIVPDDPLRALSPEIFMRDYYEPRLVAPPLGRRTAAGVTDLGRAEPSAAGGEVLWKSAAECLPRWLRCRLGCRGKRAGTARINGRCGPASTICGCSATGNWWCMWARTRRDRRPRPCIAGADGGLEAGASHRP